jgi:excisionase family DNA binding protein
MDNKIQTASPFNQGETVNAEQAAALMFAESETVLELARSGTLPGTKIGKSWVFLREDVLTFLRQRVREDTAERLRLLDARKNPAAVLLEPRPKRRRREHLVLPGLPPYLP